MTKRVSITISSNSLKQLLDGTTKTVCTRGGDTFYTLELATATAKSATPNMLYKSAQERDPANPAKFLTEGIEGLSPAEVETFLADFFESVFAALGDNAVETAAKAVHSRQRDTYLAKASKASDPDLRKGYYALANRNR